MNLTRLFRTASFRLAVMYLAVFLASVSVLGALAYFTVRGALERQIEANVRAEVASLAAAYRAGGMDRMRDMARDRKRGRAWRFHYQVISPDGALAIHSVTTTSSGEWSNPRGLSDRQSGIKALTVALDDKYKLSVASSAEVLNDLEQVLMEVLGASLLASLLLGLGGGYWISSRYLARVDNIASTAQTIIAGDLKRRIPVQSTNDELDRLAVTLNAMLDRINELMESLRQVSNDIAHDLRTPLSRLRQRLESAQQLETSSAPVREKLGAAISETDNILDTFGALLRIAQIEAGTRKAGFTMLNFSETVTNVGEAYAPVLQDDQKELVIEIEDGIKLKGDRELLTQLIANLIENTARHTPPGTTVGVSLTTDHRAALLCVSDNGPGVPASERSKIFDRFYRADHSRNTLGSGLGLNLVKAVADLHEAKICLMDKEPGLIVELTFPKINKGVAQ